MAVRFKAWVCGCLLAGIAGSYPAGLWMSVCCECCVLSGEGLCVGLVIRPEETYREREREGERECVYVCVCVCVCVCV